MLEIGSILWDVDEWLTMISYVWCNRHILCFERIIFEIIIEHLEYGWCTILESWRGYIRWTSIFSIDHLRAWEHDVWDYGCMMGGLYFS